MEVGDIVYFYFRRLIVNHGWITYKVWGLYGGMSSEGSEALVHCMVTVNFYCNRNDIACVPLEHIKQTNVKWFQYKWREEIALAKQGRLS